MLQGCVANFECIVRKKVESGDHTTFFGEIVAAHQTEKELNRIYNFGEGIFVPAVRNI
ncbi:MAG: flavin reductase [Bacillota bacterium]